MKNYVAKINLNGVVGEVHGVNPQDLADGVVECIEAMQRAIDRAKARGTLVQGGYGVGGEGIPREAPAPRGQRASIIPTKAPNICGCCADVPRNYGHCANCGCTRDECCCDDGYCEEEEPPHSNAPNITDLAWWQDMMSRAMAINDEDADAFGHAIGRADPMGNY